MARSPCNRCSSAMRCAVAVLLEPCVCTPLQDLRAGAWKNGVECIKRNSHKFARHLIASLGCAANLSARRRPRVHHSHESLKGLSEQAPNEAPDLAPEAGTKPIATSIVLARALVPKSGANFGCSLWVRRIETLGANGEQRTAIVFSFDVEGEAMAATADHLSSAGFLLEMARH